MPPAVREIAMQFARTTGPFLEHDLVDAVDAAGRRVLDDALLEEAGTPAEGGAGDTPAPRGRER